MPPCRGGQFSVGVGTISLDDRPLLIAMGDVSCDRGTCSGMGCPSLTWHG